MIRGYAVGMGTVALAHTAVWLMAELCVSPRVGVGCTIVLRVYCTVCLNWTGVLDRIGLAC